MDGGHNTANPCRPYAGHIEAKPATARKQDKVEGFWCPIKHQKGKTRTVEKAKKGAEVLTAYVG